MGELLRIAEALNRTGDAKQAGDVYKMAVSAASQIKEADDESSSMNSRISLIDAYGKVSELLRIAEAIMRTGDAKQAGDVYRMTISAAVQINNPNNKANRLLDIAEGLMQTGDAKQTGELQKMAVSAASRIDNKGIKSGVLERVAWMLAIQDGKMRKAFNSDEQRIAETIVAAFPKH